MESGNFLPNEFKACGVTQEEIKERIAYLSKSLAWPVVDEITKREVLDISTILMLFNRARLVEQLVCKPGFNRVRRDILAIPKPSLYEPHGQWFQLRVGSFLTYAGEDVSFEQELAGRAKDIVLRGGRIVVECKSFTRGEKFKHSMNSYLNFGVLPTTNPENPKAFDKKYGFWGFPLPHLPGERDEHGATWITMNEYERFFSNALEAKYSQMVAGTCNIIACNVDPFTANINKLTESIVELLTTNDFERISGLLLVQDAGIAEEDYKMKGLLRYAVSLVENPVSKIKIPSDIIESINKLLQSQSPCCEQATGGTT